MTTSYDVEVAGSDSGQPSHDAKGYQVWNPSVGRYFKPAAVKRESYGGIIGALQDIHVQNSGVTKSYPENFAGIIAALQDLGEMQYNPGSDAGDKPPGGSINIDINGQPIWEITEQPKDGQLWFDTRQGRLFVWVEDDWYQTNGADGLAIITDTGKAPEVSAIVPGQFWWESSEQVLYIFDGTYMLPDGSTTDDPASGGTPVWKYVADPDEANLQTTATLPLAVIGPRVTALQGFDYLPELDLSLGTMQTQKDYNEWIFDSLTNLDKGLQDFNPVIIGTDPPGMPAEGQLWYDTESLELSIFYIDDDRGQWVPTSVAYAYNEELAKVSADVAAESKARELAIHNLYEHITTLETLDDTEVQALRGEIQDVLTKVERLPVYDLSAYQLASTGAVQYNELNAKITALETEAPDYSLLMSRSEIEEEITQLTDLIEQRADLGTLQTVAASIPDVSNLASQDDVAAAVAGITVDYLPRDGGVVNGSFIVNKTSYDEPAFDFSQESWSSVNALKFKTNSPAEDTATFGTTPHAYEYAWNFNSNEDFCWVYNDSNKVFSITSEGPACSTIYFGDIQQNDNNGRVIFNKIDVKERLNTYQTAFEQVRQGVANATDFDSLKANILSALANV